MRRITRVLYAASVTSLLALFPLTTALVPGLVMPLHIFEPRYRLLIEELLAMEEPESREFGIIAVRDGRDPHRDGIAALYPVGTSAVLRSADRLPDGRYDIVIVGSRRFVPHSLDVSAPLIRAEAEFLDDVTGLDDQRLAGLVHKEFQAYRTLLGGQVASEQEMSDHETSPEDDGLPDDPTTLSYLVTAAMVIGVPERQELLATATTTERLHRAHRLLRREIAIIANLGALPAVESLIPTPSEN